jgi:hypothetical protein
LSGISYFCLFYTWNLLEWLIYRASGLMHLGFLHIFPGSVAQFSGCNNNSIVCMHHSLCSHLLKDIVITCKFWQSLVKVL